MYLPRPRLHRPLTLPPSIKWKPVSENSIDFRLNLEFPPLEPDSDDPDDPDETESALPDYDSLPAFHLSVFMGDDTYKKWAEMYVTSDEWETLKKMNIPLDDLIVECAMDEKKRWRYMRFRKDKKHGNHISTVDSVMESVRDGVTKEDLVKEAIEIRKAWKTRAAAAAAAAAQGRATGRT